MTRRSPGVVSGNAALDDLRDGWFVGHFMEAGDPRATTELEVKWAVYRGGERRDGWGVNRVATTLAVLVSGRFHLWFPDRDVVLAEPGDFALWEPGVPHDWQAEGPAVVFTVRWPSVAGDSVGVAGPGAQKQNRDHSSANIAEEASYDGATSPDSTIDPVAPRK